VDETTIQSLYDALETGDEEVLENLLPPLRVRLTRLAEKRVRGPGVEEIVQETLATLWAKRQSVREPAHLLPFLFQILRHKIGSAYLRAGREQARRAGEGARQDQPADAGIHPEALLAASETGELIAKAIRKIADESPGLAEVLDLLREGGSAREIAETLGMEIGAVRTRICRARKQLREILNEEFGLDL
jgi:RNA polymerase sigma-70 factor (ECF subfamily)